MQGPQLILLLSLLVAYCLAAPPTYYPSGPQTDVPETSLLGWRRCWNTSYAIEGAEVDVLALYKSCSGDYLLYGCRADGATQLTVLAAGRRTAVLNDTGNSEDYPTSVTTDNGVDWYYNLGSSIGFAKEGDAILKDSCDSINGSYPDLKLCWLAGNNENKYLYDGYRCGSATGISNGWTREIWVPDPCGNKNEGDACDNGSLCTVNTCKSGVCVSGSAVTCLIADGCISSTCNAKTGECNSFCPDPEGTPIENKLQPTVSDVSSGSTTNPINYVFIFFIVAILNFF